MTIIKWSAIGAGFERFVIRFIKWADEYKNRPIYLDKEKRIRILEHKQRYTDKWDASNPWGNAPSQSK